MRWHAERHLVRVVHAALQACADLEEAGAEVLLDAIDDAIGALEADPGSTPPVLR